MTAPDPGSPIFQRLDLTARRPYTNREYAGRLAWAIVQATLFRLPIPQYGKPWRAMLLRTFGATLASHVNVRRTARVWHPWLLKMGLFSTLGDGAVVYNLGPVEIGDQTVISQEAFICAGTHDYTLPNLPLKRPTIIIGSGVWVAMQAFIGPGVTIGDNTVVGAARSS